MAKRKTRAQTMPRDLTFDEMILLAENHCGAVRLHLTRGAWTVMLMRDPISARSAGPDCDWVGRSPGGLSSAGAVGEDQTETLREALRLYFEKFPPPPP